jgi:hypothetical protein
MTNNKAREVNNPIIKQLLDETTAEELAKIDAEMTNNKQQTAVEWLNDELIKNHGIQANLYSEFEQAKEMEKERTINFTEDWYFNGPLLGVGIDVKNTIEQHFNETYGGGEQ